MKNILFAMLAFITLTGFGNKEVRVSCNELVVMDAEESSPPRVMALSDNEVTVKEGENVHFEVLVMPVADVSMRVYVYYNGKPLGYAERFEQSFKFGFFTLDIKNVNVEDSGVYEVFAYNALGSASVKFTLKVNPR